MGYGIGEYSSIIYILYYTNKNVTDNTPMLGHYIYHNDVRVNII